MAENVVDELLIELRLRTAGLEAGLAAAMASLERTAARADRLTKQQAVQLEAAAQRQAEAARRAAEQAAEAAERAAARCQAAVRAAEAENSVASIQAALTAQQEAERTAQVQEQTAKRAAAAQQAARQAAAQVGRAAAAEAQQQAEQAAQAQQAAAQKASEAVKQAASVAKAALAALVSAAWEAVEAAQAYEGAFSSLRAQAGQSGQDFASLQAAAEALAQDGLLSATDAALSLQNLLAGGFDAQEAVQMLERLKDAAAFNRKDGLSIGQALRDAAQGLKEQNGALLANAGVTQSVSGMWKAYAASIGKSVEQLSQAEKRQAAYNGILDATNSQVGNAAQYAATFAGQQAALGAATLQVQQALGSVAQDVLEPLLRLLTPILEGLAQFISANPALVAAIAAAAAVALGCVAAFGAWKTATDLLTGSLVGLQAAFPVMGAISLAVGAIAGIVAACKASTGAAQQAAEQLAKLRGEIENLGGTVSSAQAALQALEDASATSEDLAAAKSKLAEVFPDLVIGYDREGEAILATNALIRERIELLRQERQEKQKQLEEQAQAAVMRGEEELKKLQKEIARQEERLADLKRRLATEKETMYYGMYGTTHDIYRVGIENGEERRQTLVEQEKEAVSALSLAYQTLYAAQLEALGELDQARKLAIQDEMDAAAAQGLSAEQFLKNAQAILESEEAMAPYIQEVNKQLREQGEALDVAAEYEKRLEAAQKANGQTARARQLRAYLDEVRKGHKDTKAYQQAVEGLREAYGGLGIDVERNILALENLVSQDEATAKAGEEAARQGISNLRDAVTALRNVQTAGSEAYVTLAGVIAALATLEAGVGKGPVEVPELPKAGGGGGGGGSRKKAWEEELERLEHLAALGEDVAQRQIEAYQRILDTAKLTTQERWDLEEKLYDQTQALLQEKLDNSLELYGQLRDLDAEGAAQRAAALTQLLASERLTGEERARLTRDLNETKRALDGDYLADYIEHLQALLRADELNAGQRKQVLEELLQARLSQMERAKEAQRAAIDAQIGRVEAARDAQIEAAEAARDAQVRAVEEQIAALDTLLAARKRQKEDAGDQDKLNRLTASLSYEKDAYNRDKLRQQIEDLQAQMADKAFERDIQAQKEALTAQKDAIEEQAKAEIDSLRKRAEAEIASLRERADKQAQWYQQYGEAAMAFQTQESQREADWYGEREQAAQAFHDGMVEQTQAEKAQIHETTVQSNEDTVATYLSYEAAMASAGDTLGNAIYRALAAHFDAMVRAAEATAQRIRAALAEARTAADELNGLRGESGVEQTGLRSLSVNVYGNVDTPYRARQLADAAAESIASRL